MWTPPNIDLSKPDLLRKVFLDCNFSTTAADNIIAAAKQQPWKDALVANTQKVLAQGAFGAPWFWVRNPSGAEEPFFGSDRYVVLAFSLYSSFGFFLFLLSEDGRTKFGLGSILCGSS